MSERQTNSPSSFRSRIESFIRHFPKAIHAADLLLPEIVKSGIRRHLFQENYPQSEPLTRRINGVEGRFWIRNFSDWYRIAREGFEGDFATELIATIQPNDIFLDVGSAQGFYSILAAKKGTEVYAVDPDPISIRTINDNLALNPEIQERVHTLSIALGNQEGELMLNVDLQGTYAPSLRRTSRGLTQQIPVRMIPLDTLIAQGETKSPTVVKIDVEGAEGLVLDGMRDLLTSGTKPRHLFIEIHELYLPQFGTSSQQVLQQITELGYMLSVEPRTQRGKHLYHFVPR